jgi:hypothetical protein
MARVDRRRPRGAALSAAGALVLTVLSRIVDNPGGRP